MNDTNCFKHGAGSRLCGCTPPNCAAERAVTASAAPTIDTPEFRAAAEEYRNAVMLLDPAYTKLVKLAQAHGDARVEEARREGYDAGYVQGNCNGEFPALVVAENADLRAQIAAQRPAGGHVEQVTCNACEGTGDAGGCTDCGGKGYVLEPVAEAAAQADDEAVTVPELRAYDVIVDRRDLFDFLRAAWRDGQDHGGEMDERERWNRATDHATKAIEGWTTMQPVTAPTAQPTKGPDGAWTGGTVEQRLAILHRRPESMPAAKGNNKPGVAYGEKVHFTTSELTSGQPTPQPKLNILQPGALPDDELSAFEKAWPDIHKQGGAYGWLGIARAAWQAALRQPGALDEAEDTALRKALLECAAVRDMGDEMRAGGAACCTAIEQMIVAHTLAAKQAGKGGT